MVSMNYGYEFTYCNCLLQDTTGNRLINSERGRKPHRDLWLLTKARESCHYFNQNKHVEYHYCVFKDQNNLVINS